MPAGREVFEAEVCELAEIDEKTRHKRATKTDLFSSDIALIGNQVFTAYVRPLACMPCHKFLIVFR
jgi:hypothetical protein